MEKDFRKSILLSITGANNIDWQEKLKEINELKIKEVAVFLSRFDPKERDNFYRFLIRSSIESVPFVHLRGEDVGKEEMKFFIDKYKTNYFNIHENEFKVLDQWEGYWDKLYLEMDYNDKIEKNVKVRRIGGFCVDLSHFKCATARGTEEANYIFSHKDQSKIICNHLNGYSAEKMEDKHVIDDLRDFDYLTTLPKYVFGEIIALEVDNSIKEQIKFREYVGDLLNSYFKDFKAGN